VKTKPTLKLLCLVFFLMAAPAVAKPRIKVVKLSVTNPTDEARLHENIVVTVAELQRIAPDFKAGDAIVTTSDASLARRSQMNFRGRFQATTCGSDAIG